MAAEADRILALIVNTSLALGERDARLDARVMGGVVHVRKVQPVPQHPSPVSGAERRGERTTCQRQPSSRPVERSWLTTDNSESLSGLTQEVNLRFEGRRITWSSD